LASVIILDLVQRTGDTGDLTPSVTFIGAGRRKSVLASTPTSTEKCFFQVNAGYSAGSTFKDFSIESRTDVYQDGLGIISYRRDIDATGGTTLWRFSDFSVTSSYGDAVVMVGGDNALAPNQFLEFDSAFFTSKRRSSLRVYGQFGQVRLNNGAYSGVTANSSAPLILLSRDNRRTEAITAASTVNNTVTQTATDWNTGLPVRIIGTGLPTGLSSGVTYYVRKYGLSAGGPYTAYSLHATTDAVANNTPIVLGTTGTLSSYYVSPIYAVSTGTNSFITEFPHNLATGAVLSVVGTSLPTGLATATDYFVIRVGVLEYKLATTYANALTGTAIAFSGGTLSAFGFSTGTTSQTSGGYSVDFNMPSTETGICGVYLNAYDDVQLRLHVEDTKNAMYLHNSQATVRGGHFANAGNDSGNGCVLCVTNTNSRVVIEGAPFLSGTNDKILSVSGAAVYVPSSSGFCTASAGTTTSPSSGLLTQMAAATTINVGGSDFVFINTSATPITTINSKLGPRSVLKIMAWSGSIVLQNGGNILLPNSPLTLPQNAVATLELVDTVGTWVLTGLSI
jgi:hypothetical protein